MEKYILQWSYWLGVACLVIALVWRVLNALGSFLPLPMFFATGKFVWYGGFLRWGLLFFVTTISSASYIGLRSPKS